MRLDELLMQIGNISLLDLRPMDDDPAQIVGIPTKW